MTGVTKDVVKDAEKRRTIIYKESVSCAHKIYVEQESFVKDMYGYRANYHRGGRSPPSCIPRPVPCRAADVGSCGLAPTGSKVSRRRVIVDGVFNRRGVFENAFCAGEGVMLTKSAKSKF